MVSVACETYSSVDLPYNVTHELPPIFESKLAKALFKSKSLPNIASLTLVTHSEEAPYDESSFKRFSLEAKNSDDLFNCKTCGLAFKSQRELQDHDQTYQFCCRHCSICYGTVKEALEHVC